MQHSINTLESNPTWILPMYQCNKIEQDFTKQRPILEIDFLLDSGATLNLLNEDIWNEIKYNNPDVRLEQANKTLTAANNKTIETFGPVTLNLTPDKTSNSRNKPQHNFSIHFYVTQMEKSNGKTIYKSMHYFEPINKYQNLSFTDIKDLHLLNANLILTNTQHQKKNSFKSLIFKIHI